jgi:hypothetical protein
MKATDDAPIGMNYRGIRQGPIHVMNCLKNGEVVDPAGYSFRIAPLFETEAPRYDWLNKWSQSASAIVWLVAPLHRLLGSVAEPPGT